MEEWIGVDEQRAETPLGQRRKGAVDLARGGGHQHVDLQPEVKRGSLNVMQAGFDVRVAWIEKYRDDGGIGDELMQEFVRAAS